MVGREKEMKIGNHQPVTEPVKKEPILDNLFVVTPATISNSNSETNTDHNESTTDSNKGTRRPDQDSGLSSTNTTGSILSHDEPLNEGSLNEGSYSDVFIDNEEKNKQDEGEEVLAPSEDVQTITLPTNSYIGDTGGEGDTNPFVDIEDSSTVQGDIGNSGSKSENLEQDDILITTILKERESQTPLEPVKSTRHQIMPTLSSSDYSEPLKNRLDRSKGERPPHELEDLKKLDPNILPVHDTNDDVYSFLVEPKLEQSVKERRDNICIETYYHHNDCTTLLSYHSFVNVFKDVSETMIAIPVPSSVSYEYMTAPKTEIKTRGNKEELVIGRNPINKGYACQIRDDLMLKIVEDKLQSAKGTLILLKEKEPPDTHRDGYCCSDYWSFQTMIDQSGHATLCMNI